MEDDISQPNLDYSHLDQHLWLQGEEENRTYKNKQLVSWGDKNKLTEEKICR